MGEFPYPGPPLNSNVLSTEFSLVINPLIVEEPLSFPEIQVVPVNIKDRSLKSGVTAMPRGNSPRPPTTRGPGVPR